MRKSLLFISLGVLVVLSLTLASYFVLTRFYPAEEIRRMTIAMSRLQTVSESAGFHWTVVDEGEDVYTTLYTNGVVRLSDPTKFDHATAFRAVFLSKINLYKDLSGEVRHEEGKTFLTYTAPGPVIKGFDFSKEGTWVSFKAGEFPSWGSLIPNLKMPFSTTTSRESWKPEGIKRLRVLLGLTDIFLVKYDGAEEVVRGEKTRVIDARFDAEALKSFLYDVIRAREEREPSDEERLAIAATASDLEHLSVRLWIGKKDHLLYRLQAVGGIQKEKTKELMPIDVRIDFSDFNKEIGIEAPAFFVSFSSVYQSLMRSFPQREVAFGRPSSIPTITEDASIREQSVIVGSDRDQDGLDNILETFFGTNPNSADTDNDGSSDGNEVKRGTNPRGKGSLFGFGLGN